jgi:predicted RNA polymerase sigma factor
VTESGAHDIAGGIGGSSPRDSAVSAIETVIRIESARLIAGLARFAGGDIGLAEELAQDAVVAALEQWPREGVPLNPGAWLTTVAKRRAIDQFRRNSELERKYAEIGRAIEASGDDGTAALDRAIKLGERGPYVLQAAITACHARAYRAEQTDWAQITELYGVLAEVMPSPVVELNRAVAVSMAFGPEAGLALVDQLAGEPSLRDYHLLPSVRGDLLMNLGRLAEAQTEFERASELTGNARERRLTQERARSAARLLRDESGADQAR